MWLLTSALAYHVNEAVTTTNDLAYTTAQIITAIKIF